MEPLMFMSRKGIFSSGNTCEAFISASAFIENIITSLGPSLPQLCIPCYHLHLHKADAQLCEQHSLVVPTFRKPHLGISLTSPKMLVCHHGLPVLMSA